MFFEVAQEVALRGEPIRDLRGNEHASLVDLALLRLYVGLDHHNLCGKI